MSRSAVPRFIQPRTHRHSPNGLRFAKVDGVPNARQYLGAHGEAVAARWYVARGFTVIDRNWRIRGGEIDLVVQLGSQLVFCEVKTRTTDAFGSGLDAVGWTKQQRLRKLAFAWLDAHPAEEYRAIRFDVASIVAGVIEVVEAAF